jgi:hypothetical protein
MNAGLVLPFVQTVVSAVTAGNSWGNVLRRYLIGLSDSDLKA